MAALPVIVVLASVIGFAAVHADEAAVKSAGQFGEQLAGHPSPYLALHADDPVHWRLWDERAFAQARREAKPLLVSSGYFSCHWCHVMQRESFRDARIAAIINRHFIPVKVDRELSPALDAALLDFARTTRGHAGWPLQVFVTPDGYPLVAATYQPPREFAALLNNFAARWRADAAALSATARAAAEQNSAPTRTASPPAPGFLAASLRAAALGRADELQGGFGAQSRFPHAPQLLALLELHARRPDTDLGDFLRLTLRQIATQGLHDELNGGFFRYTVDPDWQTPHFEKLLIDNALLARVFLRAAEVLGDRAWRDVAEETLDFILRELNAPNGGYFVALSALDGNGVDGGAYLWPRAVLRQIAGPHRPLLERYWALETPAPFAAGHLPIPRLSRAQLAEEFGLPFAEVNARLADVYARLRRQRAEDGPQIDRQIVAGANGLLLTALSEASVQTPDAGSKRRYAQAAERLATLLRGDFITERGLMRSRDVAAGLEDYAYVAQGLASWHAYDGSLEKIRPVLTRLLQQAWTRYHRDGRWNLGEDALLRWGGASLALADTGLPAPSAVLLDVSERLDGEPGNREVALRTAWPAVIADPFRHASWLSLYP